jgi:arsenical pump membrane protein
VLAVGLPAAVAAAGLNPSAAGAAARQDWPPFVLVCGLLLLGLVAGRDGLFEAAGRLVARSARGGRSLLVASAVVLAVVTALMNLDTTVVFLTPVVILAARRVGAAGTAVLYLSVMMANGASLLLVGSNLTNLIVVDQNGLSAGAFALHMLPVWVASVVAVTVTVALVFRRDLKPDGRPTLVEVSPAPTHLLGVGLAGVAVAVPAMLVLPVPAGALVVLGVGLAVAARRAFQGVLGWGELPATVNGPVLLGLFGLAVALGTLGRSWAGPASLLAHRSSAGTAVVATVGAVVVNNLPAASLLAARPVPDPYALLVGLDIGPNLAVTGALSAILWLQSATAVGARPSAARFTRVGLVVTPVALAAALGALAVAH